MANRSAQLMRLAARLLFRRCRNVLVTDLNWPAYQALLAAEATRTGMRLTTACLRERVLSGTMCREEVIDHLSAQYRRAKCDGVFLPAVCNLGVLLPVNGILSRLESIAEVRFSVVDATQAFCHVRPSLYAHGDFLLAGCHKWLGAYLTMGIGFCPRSRSRSYIDGTLRRMVDAFRLDDPLLRFTEQLESGRLDGYSETTNITPLFSCCGALADSRTMNSDEQRRLQVRRENAHELSDIALKSGWTPVRPASEFQTGILLLQASQPTTSVCVESVRAAFQRQGVILSAYDHSMIRLSMPDQPFETIALDRLRDVLGSIVPTRPTTLRRNEESHAPNGFTIARRRRNAE